MNPIFYSRNLQITHSKKDLERFFLPCIKVKSCSRKHPKPHAFIIPKEEFANLYVLDEHLKQERKRGKKNKMSVQKDEHMPQAITGLVGLIQYYNWPR